MNDLFGIFACWWSDSGSMGRLTLILVVAFSTLDVYSGVYLVIWKPLKYYLSNTEQMLLLCVFSWKPFGVFQSCIFNLVIEYQKMTYTVCLISKFCGELQPIENEPVSDMVVEDFRT